MFVQVIQGQVADAAELRASLDRWLRELAPRATGWLGSTSGVTADGTAIALACFESAEAARRNSERPEQHEWWMETSKVFGGDVAFHDCNEVYEFAGGVPDAAGFVQVMQGRYTDKGRALQQMRDTEQVMNEARPDVIGGLMCLHDEDQFTQAIYFRTEAEARAGEQQEPSPEVARLMSDMQQSIAGGIRYFDLKHPWLDRP